MPWAQISALSLSLAVAPCQLRCAYCDAAGIECTRVLPIEVFRRLLQEYAELAERRGIHNANLLLYNEPANHPDLAGLWREMHRLGLSASTALLATNGARVAMDPHYLTLLDELRDSGLRTVQLTAYGLEQTHDRLAGRNGAFRDLMVCAERCRVVGLSVTATYPYFRRNHAELRSLAARLAAVNGQERPLAPFVFAFTPQGVHLEGERPTWQELEALGVPAGVSNAYRQAYRSEAEWVALACGPHAQSLDVVPPTALALQIDGPGAAYAWIAHPAFQVGHVSEGLDTLFVRCVAGQYEAASFVTPTGVSRLARQHGDARSQGLHSVGSVWAKWLNGALSTAAAVT
jgi:pyruvate-formate lyase-activating enzyme